ncbi:RNase adapter RapZ [Demequina activiva]|uniref:Nucleotide-binding protein n=1 Tax=Demequina activiva TaxID=1582364 RepID=A0A919Q576_9MICO|nr:RNase adapter RapZ [Demequina activiva]GIG54498.1 nucleotide-binding protein [Demequina activiva]
MTEEPPAVTYPSGIPRPSFEAPEVAPEVMVLTGMSGAGRTKAAAVLADLGWYVVDNLPPHLLSGLVTSLIGGDTRRRLAAVVDVRGGEFFKDLETVVDDLEVKGVPVRLLFLDASDEALVRRFEEARRPHPLQQDGTLLEGIARERTMVADVRDRADHIIDTSRLNVHELRDVMTREVSDETPRLQINVQSFGFKNGIPADADFVADVRFLHNPHWVPELRPLTGLDPAVRDHVLGAEGAQEFVDGYASVIDSALHLYRAHDKHAVTIAVGCTGGKHRSVVMAEALGADLRARGYDVRTTHRDRPRA